MRKRLVIGAIAVVVVVIGLAACVSSRSTSETVEWHKAEYLQAIGKTADGQPPKPVAMRSSSDTNFGFCVVVVTKAQRAQFAKGQKKARSTQARGERHYTALLQLGYLAQRSVVITGAQTRAVVNRLGSLPDPFVKAEFGEIGTNQLIFITAPTNTIEQHLEFIRKADAPVYEDAVMKIDVP